MFLNLRVALAALFICTYTFKVSIESRGQRTLHTN